MSLFPMAGTVIKNLFSRPATRLYPFVKREPFAGTRGHVEIDFSQCIHCGICSKRCPTHAIAVDRAKKEWKIDHLACVICGNCALVCPKKCLSIKEASSHAVKRTDKAAETETHANA